MKTVYFILFCLLLTTSCRRDPDLTGYRVVSFSDEVQPLIHGNCTQAGCHGDTDSETFRLITYEEIVQKVTPGKAYKSDLYRAITGRSEEFMPPSPSAPLSDDQIRTIFVWIEQGAPNN